EQRYRYAVAQAGLTWAHFDQVTQVFGLACTGPIVSMTGIAGFTLGGGFGWLHRKIGLGSDNLNSATVVTADGHLVMASDANNHNLFWGLRGSGWNFGVITSMRFQLHPIGPSVVAGLIYFPLARFPELVGHYRNRIAQFPNELTTWFFLRLAPPVPIIPKYWVGRLERDIRRANLRRFPLSLSVPRRWKRIPNSRRPPSPSTSIFWIQASIGVWPSWNSAAWSGLGFQCGHQVVGVEMPNLSKRWLCLADELTTACKSD
ncbi:MAG: FAD-binding oxidoreductase, partial [Verrucomicrobia bacterium]|nr:FAD-binding oxidoreductase [Verrucomicrobiota bacterium]